MPKITELPLKATLSTDDYMAISNESESYKNPIGQVLNDMAEVNSQINASQDRRIHLLEEASIGKLYTQETTTSYSNDVSIPSGALSLATLDMLGGMSRKGKNLYQPQNDTQTVGGLTGKYENGKLTVNGVATGPYSRSFITYITDNMSVFKSGRTYTFSVEPTSNLRVVVLYRVGSTYNAYGGISLSQTFTVGDDTNQIIIRVVTQSDGYEYVNEVVHPMLNEGSSALPYEPYTPNLIDGKVDDVVVYGKNLFNAKIQEGVYNEATYSVANDGLITQSASDNSGWSISHKRNFTLESGTYTASIIGKSSSMYFQMRNLTDNTDIFSTRTNSITFTINGTKTLGIKTYGNASEYPHSFYIQLEKGNVATSYKPYHEPTHKPIPSSVLSLPNYGIGLNNDVYNYLEFADGKVMYHERVDILNLGNVSFNYLQTQQKFKFSLNGMKAKSNLLCEKYNFNGNGGYDSKEMLDLSIETHNTSNVIYIKDTLYTDVTSFKQAMQGVMLYYELATETITDVTDLFPIGFNELEVEANGHINFHYDNDYKVDIPNTISYLIDIKGALNG